MISKKFRVRVKRPRALDLFCGAGGASLGLFSAGFIVHGVDISLMGRAGRLKNPVILRGWEVDVGSMAPCELRDYDFVWASPPCQAFTPVRRLAARAAEAPNLIPRTRALIEDAGIPGVIENVPGAPIRADLVLTGPTVGEPGMIRRRHFEFINLPPQVAAAVAVDKHCKRAPDIVSLSGNSTPHAPNCSAEHRHFESLTRQEQLAWKQRCIGAPWMSWHECNQAVPVRYAYVIGAAVIEHIDSDQK